MKSLTMNIQSKFALSILTILVSQSLTAAERPLYERLGGKKGVTSIANAFVETLSSDQRLMKNTRIRELEKGTDKKGVKIRLADEICKAAGGPCKPNRTPVIANAPKDLKLGTMEWLYVVGDADAALSKCKVGSQEKAELLGMLFNARDAQ
jgi:hemoglobin